MSCSISHPLGTVSPGCCGLFPSNPHSPPKLSPSPHAQLFLCSPDSPQPCRREQPEPYSVPSPDLCVRSLFLRLTELSACSDENKNTRYVHTGVGGQNEGKKKMWIRTSYLVLRIFRNCKISENCISLRALKNLKPGKRNEIETHYSHCVVLMFTLSRLVYSCQGRRDLKFLQTIKPSRTLVIVLHSDSWLV